VVRKGAKRPIFEGNMPPKKCTPNIGANIGAITGILKRRLLCMGCTFTGARTDYFIIALNMWFVSWESTLASVKASKRGANVTRVEIIKYADSKYDALYKNC
jgi:hypothetical protein